MVIGNDSLPAVEDRARLPFVSALPMDFKSARFTKTENHNPEPDLRYICFGGRYEYFRINNNVD